MAEIVELFGTLDAKIAKVGSKIACEWAQIERSARTLKQIDTHIRQRVNFAAFNLNCEHPDVDRDEIVRRISITAKTFYFKKADLFAENDLDDSLFKR